MKNECNIVQDLLPNYIDKVTTQQTNTYIEEHLKTCDNCQKVLENMTHNLTPEKKLQCKAETNYLKKFNKRWKLLLTIIILILFIFVATIVRKMIIYNILINRSGEIYSDIEWVPDADFPKSAHADYSNMNIHQKVTYHTPENLQIIEQSFKDGTQLTNMMSCNYESKKLFTSTFYQSEDETIYLENTDKGKRMQTQNISNGLLHPYSYTDGILVSELPIFYLSSSFRKVSLNGKECYLIQYKNKEYFREIETGLLIKYIDNDQNIVLDCEYGTVQGIIQKPDTTGYTEYYNNVD